MRHVFLWNHCSVSSAYQNDHDISFYVVLLFRYSSPNTDVSISKWNWTKVERIVNVWTGSTVVSRGCGMGEHGDVCFDTSTQNKVMHTPSINMSILVNDTSLNSTSDSHFDESKAAAVPLLPDFEIVCECVSDLCNSAQFISGNMSMFTLMTVISLWVIGWRHWI